MKKCLNVGSGIDYKPSTEEENWVNVDVNERVKPDIVCRVEDLHEHFEADTFDEVHMLHVWEHCEDLLKVMEEIWRVMKPGARLIVSTPYYTAENATADPTHKHSISRITYSFLSYPIYEANAKNKTAMSQLFPQCDFDIKKIVGVPCAGNEVFKDAEFAQKHYFNVLEELQVELECVKPIRMFDIEQYQTRIS